MASLGFFRGQVMDSISRYVVFSIGLICSIFVIGCSPSSSQTNVLDPVAIIAPEDHPFINIDSIVVHNNRVYVSDIHTIKVFDTDGNYLKMIGEAGSADGQFAGEVIGLAINHKNELLAVDMENYRVQIFDLDGQFKSAFGSKGVNPGQFLTPQGIVTDQHGLIFVSDKERSDIQVFSPSGEFLYQISQKGSGRVDLLEPETMVIKDERLYIADEGNFRIQVFDLRGNYIKHLPEVGVLITPQQEAGMDDMIYNTAIYKRYDRTLEGDVEGIAFDQYNRLYFVDEDNGIIGIIERGAIIASFKSTVPLMSADGIAFSADFNYLYVCDQGNNQVQVFDISAINTIKN
jgi:DNA-binding beta-propeller fold protein YncE